MTDSLERIISEVVVCDKCPLHEGRTKAVPGEGPSNAEIMFIGEGPGFHEDQSGRPFVGAAGNFLEELLEGIGLKREEVYITNVVKCRPPGNRDPQPIEFNTCTNEYLQRQIYLINPRIIVTLGRFSMGLWFPAARISRIHGQSRRVGSRLIVPMYHPAAALHQPSLRSAVIEDFQRLPGLLEKIRADAPQGSSEDEPPLEQAQQLSLF